MFTKNYKFLAILVSALNFLFFLLIHENLTYQYLFTSIFGEMRSLSFIFLLKFSFAGFSLALLLFTKIKKLFPRINIHTSVDWLAYIILSGALINFVIMPNLVTSYLVAFVVIFIPSFFFGLIYALIIKELGGQYNKFLFYLLLGSAIGVVSYSYLFVRIPFVIVYFVIFSILQLLLLSKKNAKYSILKLTLLLFFLLFLFAKPNFGQVYTKPVSFPVDTASKHYLTIKGAYGILDVLYLPNENRYIMFSDKNSPSTISIKGEMETVQEHAKIPYLIRTYDKSLIVGIGGGQDLVAGLYYGTNNIKAVEIDSERIHLMSKHFKDYSNNLFFDKRVKIINDSGRAFLRKNNEKFDLIVIQRPWTETTINTLFYDVSKELFTEEALDAYLNAIQDEGIIFWAVPTLSGHNVPSSMDLVLLSLKNRINILEDNMLIFYPNKDKSIIIIMMSKKYNFLNFYLSYKEKYDFVYYSSKNFPDEKDKISNTIFNEGFNKRSIDKQIFGVFDYKSINKNMLILILALFILIIYSKFRFNTINYLLYFFLGIGYEVVIIFFIIWMSFFISNPIRLIPSMFMVYFLLGSMGYLHSKMINKKLIFVICLALSFIFLFILCNNLFFEKQNSVRLIWPVVVALFLSVSYLVTFPFGYLLRSEKNIYLALSVDYMGSLFSLLVIYLLPNLDYLLGIGIYIYVLIGILIILSRRII